ncbi:putative secondary metabolism biosynthetic enzyme [Cytospora paraplurivora]|uniref:Secondary metabolism biosynthetic enzyme n=1 Tax=Cytospora paraplurivora TaxID=2898453 RepID=A0AAN9U6G3_9PEZI
MFTPITRDTEEPFQKLLSSQIPPWDSRQALQLLSITLQQGQPPWPTLDLIRCHSRLSRALRQAKSSGDVLQSNSLIQDTAQRIKQTYGSITDFISNKQRPALRTMNVDKSISHAYLRDFAIGFALPIEQHGKRKPVVSIALPNGPLLAAVCIAATAHYISAPTNPAAGPQQFQADVLLAGAKCILTTREDYGKLQLEGSWVQKNNILVLLTELDNDMNINVNFPNGTPICCERTAQPNAPDDIALLLFTSGTSGNKKVVPITTHSIVAGVAFVAESWAMTESDVCLNMMPLYHMPGALRGNNIRLVCNAAGGLLPSLAMQLRDTFGCVVLPSYGMTECMPISTPPMNYNLDRPGTSGITAGPDMAIYDHAFRVVRSGTVGRICIRGEPAFTGYLLPDGTIDTSVLNEDGWFDTGDMGYMDDDGYLYVTGRIKEVINRGGEIISPFEVENAIVTASRHLKSPLLGRANQALAFSVQHDVLQEVVGVVLVCPQGVPRPDLKLLHSSLRGILHQVKWPALIVYMDDLPKKNNKVLRLKLAQRLSLKQLADETPYSLRHWEGNCPKPDTDLSVPIQCSPCDVNLSCVRKEIERMLPNGISLCFNTSSTGKEIRAILAPSGPDQPPLDDQLPGHVKEELLTRMHAYLIPRGIHILHCPIPTDEDGGVDELALQKLLAEVDSPSNTENCDVSLDDRVVKVFASVLNLHAADITADGDFFELGGDSLRAGRLISVLRSNYNIHIPIDAIFQHGSSSALAAYIRERKASNWEPPPDTEIKGEKSLFVQGGEETYSSTRWWLLALQLLPMCVMYPMRRAYQWTVFMIFLSATQEWSTAQHVPGRLLNLTIAMFVARIVTKAFAPWVGIAAKWLLIGRFKEGVYPMWGPYHTRWWLVQKIVDICGHGLFQQTNYTSVLYLRLMGAKIGKHVTITGVQMGEWDLIEIDDGAILERCTVRPFAGERNTSMYLGKVRIGRNATVGMCSIVAPGTTVPDDTCIGPNSSSWEVDDADEANRDLLFSKIPGPHWALNCFVTKPVVAMSWFVSLMPWFAGLVGLVISEPLGTRTPLYSILMWFAATHRVGFHYLALVLRVSLSPFIIFGSTLVAKWTLDAVFGTLQPGPVKGRSQVDIWRMGFMKSLFSVKRLHDMTELMGQHYEGTSSAIRMLGGRVGKRVYWPGTGPSIGDYHLLDIGNDVVFGSRAHMVTSDGLGTERIKVEDRAMIADRVTLLPGTTIGKKTIMGSGALTRRNKHYYDGGTYVGSKKGDAVCLNAGSVTSYNVSKTPETCPSSGFADEKDVNIESVGTEKSSRAITRRMHEKSHDDLKPEDASPFGRAFYLKQAPYRVYGLKTIIFYNAAITVFTAFYWNVPSISAIQIVAHVFRDNHHTLGRELWYDTSALYSLFFVFIAIITTAQAILVIAAVIAAKWILLGRRKPGNYDWDKSSYCQKWQMYLTIEKLRRYCYRGNGILGMLTGTHWLVLYFRALGADIGDNCALFANGRPSLMFTEPDLIRLGDRTVIDDASIVAHINTRGRFDLNRLEVGERCVMRTGSRLLSGATMRDDSAVLEHTLVMGGDVIEKGWTMQGWPAERFRGTRVKLPFTNGGGPLGEQ